MVVGGGGVGAAWKGAGAIVYSVHGIVVCSRDPINGMYGASGIKGSAKARVDGRERIKVRARGVGASYKDARAVIYIRDLPKVGSLRVSATMEQWWARAIVVSGG